MAETSLKLQDRQGPWAGRRALIHLFAEYERARAEAQAAEKRVLRFAESIQLILDGAPASEKDELSKRFAEIKGGVQQQRVGDVNNNVVSIFKNAPGREFSVPDIVEEVNKSGFEADAKSIANVVAYLAKTGKLTKVARGQYRYVDLGVGVEYDHDRNDPTERLTEH